MTMERRCCPKRSLNFRDTRYKISVPLAMSTNIEKNKFQTLKKKRKKYSLADVGPRSAWQKLSPMLIRSGEIPSPRQISMDKDNDCAMKSERAALVRGSDPSAHGVHKTAGDTWRAPASRLMRTRFGRCCVENTRQKIWIPLRWQKIYLFSGLGEERRTPRAISRPLDRGST